MKVYQNKTVTVYDIDKILCDICGKDVYWEEREYNGYISNDVHIELKYKEGWSYGGDEGYYEIFEPDICSHCMREKVIPLIKPLLNRDCWKEEVW